MEDNDQLLARLGEVRDGIEAARSSQDIAALSTLIAVRDALRARLAETQRPSRGALEAELGRLRSQLEGFDPEVGMLTGMSMVAGGAGPGATSASSVVAAAKAAEQQRSDAGIAQIEQRIAFLEERLKAQADEE